MANEQDNNPTTGAQSDISKSQTQQQPPNQANQQQERGERTGQSETGQEGQKQFGQDKGQGSPDQGMQGGIDTQQRSDVEGGSKLSRESGEAQSGFVGSQGQQDSSNELVEDEDQTIDPARGGQGAPEGK